MMKSNLLALESSANIYLSMSFNNYQTQDEV